MAKPDLAPEAAQAMPLSLANRFLKASADAGLDLDIPAQRALAALLFKQLGHSWEEVAREYGWEDGAQARNSVWREQQLAAATLNEASRQALLTEQDTQLHWLVRQAAPLVVQGDMRAADVILKVIDKRIRLFGLEPKDDLRSVQHIIIPASATREEATAILRESSLQAALAAGRTIPHDVQDPPEPGEPGYTP